MKYILSGLGNWAPQWPLMKKAIPEAERLGFWGGVIPDHYVWGADRGGDSTLEAWTALTYLAAVTEKIHVGTLVTPIPFNLRECSQRRYRHFT